MATHLPFQARNCSVFNVILTDHFGSSCKIYDSCAGNSWFESWLKHWLSWLTVFYSSYPQYCHTNSGIGPQIIPVSLPFTSSRILHSFHHSAIYRVSQEERLVLWEVIVSVILIKKCICTRVLLRTVSERELFHCTVVWIWRPILFFPPAVQRHCLKRQLAVVTVDSDIVGVLWKMPHIFTNAEYADMPSSRELQSAFMLTVEFSKIYYTR
jgi:hypothetical protein